MLWELFINWIGILFKENEVVEDDVESCKTTTIENSTEHGEEDEDEDDVEPKLTYDRVGNDVLNILKTDSASCLTLYERVMIVYYIIVYHIQI